MQVNRFIEGRQAALAGSDSLGKQGIHLTNVVWVASGEVVRDIFETLRNGQIL